MFSFAKLSAIWVMIALAASILFPSCHLPAILPEASRINNNRVGIFFVCAKPWFPIDKKQIATQNKLRSNLLFK